MSWTCALGPDRSVCCRNVVLVEIAGGVWPKVVRFTNLLRGLWRALRGLTGEPLCRRPPSAPDLFLEPPPQGLATSSHVVR